MPRIETRHLLLVRAIAEERSVTRAAARLYVSQSALSHALAEVEARAGQPLFARGRAMVPTAAGERVLAVARRVLDELAALDAALAARPAARPIRVSTGCYTCYHWLPPALGAFARSHPDVEVRIVLEATRAPIQALRARRIDLAITSDPPPRGLRATALFDDDLVALVAQACPLARARFVAPSDLAGETLLLHDLPLDRHLVWRRFLRPAGVRPRRVQRVPLTEAIAELARAEQGIGLLARWAASSYLAAGGLVLRPLGRAGLARRWYAVRRDDDPNAAAIDALAALARPAPA